MSDLNYNPPGQGLGQGSWIVANLTEFAPDDIAPLSVYGVLPRNPSMWTYSGTHLSTSTSANLRYV